MTDASKSPYDEFLSDASQTANGTFSLENFYTASSDKKGRQTTIRVNVPPSLMRTMQEIVARRTIPDYRTTSDMIRDFLVVGCHMRLEQIDDPEFSRDTTFMRLEAEIADIYMKHQRQIKAVDDLENTLNSVNSAAEKDAVRDKARQMMNEITSPAQRERLERMTW